MAIKTTVTYKFDFYTNYEQWLDLNEFKDIIGDYVLVDGIMSYINRGDSPVQGNSRFAGYAVDRKKSQYPNSLYPNSVKSKFPSKKRRPVNLQLSGSFMSRLDVRATSNKKIVKLGMFSMSTKQAKMFETHNEGKHKYVPQRKFLPTKKGEQFKTAIMQNFIKGIEKSLKMKKVFN